MLREYFNQMASIWDETIAEKDITKMERMAERLNLKPGFIVLDVGTGTGVFLPLILERIGNKGRIVALDIAEEMLTRAQSKCFAGNIDYLCADVMDIPFDNEIFDTVVCYSSFPHFRDKRKALAEVHRTLKNGSRLSICHTKSRTEINNIHSQIEAVCNDTIPDTDEVTTMLSAAGFTEILVSDSSASYFVNALKPK